VSDIVIVAIITGAFGLAPHVMARFGGQKRALDRVAKATEINLKSIKIIFKALREQSINGESIEQERKIDEFLMDSTSSGFFRRK